MDLPRFCGSVALAACVALLAAGAALAATREEAERTIDVVDVSTGHLREVMADTEGEGPPLSLSWTPDGRGLAYMRSPCDGCAEIRLLRVGAGKPAGLGTIVGQGRAPSLGRDGKTLVYLGADGGIYTSSLAGLGARAIVRASSGGGLDHPRLSPDGRSIAFMRAQPGGKWSIEVVPRGGGPERRLTPPRLATANPAWSPDGKTIAFSAQAPDGRWQIGLVALRGGRVRLLRDGGGSDSYPTWSPDGKRIAFIREHGRLESLYVRSVAGGPLRRLTPPSLDAIQPAWSPKGDEIAFVVNSADGD